MKRRTLRMTALLVAAMLALIPLVALAQGALHFDFEGDEEGWGLTDWAKEGLSLSQSTEMASHGSGSLKVESKFSGVGGWEQASVTYFLAEPTDWSGYEKITADVFCPPGPINILGVIWLNTGDDWAFHQTQDVPLIPGEWNPITLVLGEVENAAEIRAIGVKWGTSVDRVEAAFYVDNVIVHAPTAVLPVTGGDGTGRLDAATVWVVAGIALVAAGWVAWNQLSTQYQR